MSALKYLLVVCFISFGCGNVQGMQGAGAPSMPNLEELLKNPQGVEILKALFFEYLEKNNFLDRIKEMGFEFLGTQKGELFAKLEASRKEYSTGLAGKAYGYLDQIVGRKSFPITGDADLGEEFSLQEWSMACSTGDQRVIQIFLTKPEYDHLLNVANGEDKALSLAAFGFIAGEKLNGVVPTSEGFKLLAQDKRIDSKFLIRAGLGRIPFDEWLLYEASYVQDAEKQARLEILKGIVRPTLSADRLQALKEIRDRKDRQRIDQEEKEAAQRKTYFNKLSFGAGIVATCAVLYYYATKKSATPDRTPIALAVNAE